MQSAKIYLAEALIQMLENNAFDDISIKDLTIRAGVSRMTYYRYFKEKKEVLQFYMQHLLDEFLKDDSENSYTFQSYEHIYHSFEYFKKYKSFTKCLISIGMEGIMLDALNAYTTQLPVFKRANPNDTYPFYFYAGALYNTYIQWILDDTSTPASELADIVYRTIKND